MSADDAKIIWRIAHILMHRISTSISFLFKDSFFSVNILYRAVIIVTAGNKYAKYPKSPINKLEIKLPITPPLSE